MKKSFALSLLAVGFAFAQSGLMAGSDGLHQQNAYTPSTPQTARPTGSTNGMAPFRAESI